MLLPLLSHLLPYAVALAAVGALAWVLVLHRRLGDSARRLQESRALLEQIFLQSPFPMWVADRGGTCLMLSHATERLFDIDDVSRVVGRYNVLQDSVIRDLGYLPMVERAFRGETVTLTDWYDPGKVAGFEGPSRVLHLRTIFSPIQGADGRIEHVLVMHEDITHQSRAEMDVREANRRLTAMLASSRLMSSTLDLGVLLPRIGTIAQEAMGPGCVGGLFLYDAESDGLVLRAAIGEVLPGGVPDVCIARGEGLAGQVFAEAQTIHKTSASEVAAMVASLSEANRARIGSVIRGGMPGSAVGLPIMAGGKLIGAVVLYAVRPERVIGSEDVALLQSLADHAAVAIENARLYEALQVQARELEALNRRLRRAVEELKTLDEMKTNLLSNVSHELRTPLIAITGYTDMLLQGKLGELGETQKDRLGIILRNAVRLSRLIEDLLEFSRTEMGKVELHVVTFDVREAIREAVENIRPKAEGRGIAIEADYGDGDARIKGDRDRIVQVFNNLLSNAEKFNRDGGRIRVEVRPPGKGSIRVNIVDTGIGIPREEQDRIFDRFYQVDSGLARRYGGTGIGLALSRSIVALHGGQIKVRSEPGQGSTFTVQLPIYDDRRDSGKVRVQAGPPPEAGAG